MMDWHNIKDALRDGSNIQMEVVVIDVGAIKTVRNGLKVRELTITDNYYTIGVSVFAENAVKNYEVGDIVQITGAYTTEFNNKPKISIPRKGSIKIVKKLKG